MRHRLRTLMRPDAEDHGRSPSEGEAFGVWMLGLLWALVCLWLGYLGSEWVVPGILLAGLVAVWGWRHIEWLWWFPVVLVVATMMQPLSPLPARHRFGPLDYIDLLVICVAVVAVVRAVGLGRPVIPRTKVDGLVLAILALFIVNLATSSARHLAIVDLKRFVVTTIVFYATTTVASRPRGSRWVWTAFPLATTLIGLHAIGATFLGAPALATQVAAADQVWGSSYGLFDALLVALPLSIGLAVNAGQIRARLVWALATGLGLAALALHLGGTDVLRDAMAIGVRWTPLEFWMALVAAVTLFTVARVAWGVRSHRLHEGPRWVALALTFAGYAVFKLVVPTLSGPSIPLLAVAAGLVFGTLRADRRALRAGRRIAPPFRKAA